MKPYLRLVAMLMLVSCGGGVNNVAPRNLDDACSILDQRPHFLPALQQAETRWGVPVPVQMAVIHQESKFIGNAKTPRKYALFIIPVGRQSSAKGFSQALDGTWNDYREATGNRDARRNNIDDATDFMGWYMDRASSRLGISKTDAGDLYLSYHEGLGGYARGSHQGKAWLIRVAQQVNDRAVLYQTQLSACGKL